MGWFSDRTACYLASGKPAVVQETGFSETIPTGKGLLSWKTADEAFESLKIVEANYPYHREQARKIAIEHFNSSYVLTQLLKQCS